METKKSIRADLEKKKGLFLQLGLIISLGAALVAFEWRTPYNPKLSDSGTKFDPIPIDIVPITRQEAKKEPAPVKPVITTINIVDNIADVKDEPIFDAGATPDDNIDQYIPINVITKPEDEPGIVDPNEIFKVVEEMPSFDGGDLALKQFILANLNYPHEAINAGVEGTVYLKFIIDKDGSINNIEVQRGIGFGCDDESIRVLKLCPKWNPGKQRGKPVRVQATMPFSFKLTHN